MFRSPLFPLLGSALLLAGHASATTIIAGGGMDGRTFLRGALFPLDGPISLAHLSPTNATVQVGTFNNQNFVQFAVADASPITFGTSASLLGKWQGNAADMTAAATAFNGQQVWFRVIITANPGGSFYLTGGQLFPANGGGVGDSLNISSLSLTTIIPDAMYPGAIDEQGNRILLNVPEPSMTVLGLAGGLLALRRRRA